VEFGVLGPLEVTDGRRRVWIPAAKQRMLLAALLLRVGELVTLDELAEAIWGDALPDDPRKVVQTYMSRLRQLLGDGGLIHSRPEGYVPTVARDEVDLGRFEMLLEQAREAADSGDRHREAALLREALGLWRGEPLADMSSTALHREVVARLAEQRLEALHRRIEAELALGRHAELVAELRALTQRHPLRERLWAQLMRALYRCGRQADALAAYQRVRGVLAEELGMDPGPELRALHQAILTGDPTLMVPVASARRGAWVGQFQLPVDVGDFVGRLGLVDQVTSLLDDERRVPIVALSGPAGWARPRWRSMPPTGWPGGSPRG
jgi:DNA-binding SARP family transcriptional activator